MKLLAALVALVAALILLAATPQWALGAHAYDTKILPSPRQVAADHAALGEYALRAASIARCDSRAPRLPSPPESGAARALRVEASA